MTIIRLDHETDFAGWRQAARTLRGARIAPDEVVWTVGPAAAACGVAEAGPVFEGAADFTAPKAFVDLAQAAICHRAPHRLGLLYRLLWRMRDEPNLLSLEVDADVDEARRLAREAARATHRMKAFLRFDRVADDPPTYAAWFEPEHRVLRRAAPFFADRFGERRFMIQTPEACARWDGTVLRFESGRRP